MIAAIVRSYHLTDFLKDVIKQFDWIDKVLVVNQMFLGYEPAEDDTEEIVKKLNQPNVELLKLPPMLEHEGLNEAIKYLKDYDFIYLCDADEFYKPGDLKKLLELFSDESTGIDNQGMGRMVDVHPDGSEHDRGEHRPIVIIRPTLEFYYQRCAYGTPRLMDITMRHYGYSLKDMKWKLGQYIKTGRPEEVIYGKRRILYSP